MPVQTGLGRPPDLNHFPGESLHSSEPRFTSSTINSGRLSGDKQITLKSHGTHEDGKDRGLRGQVHSFPRMKEAHADNRVQRLRCLREGKPRPWSQHKSVPPT